MFVMLTNTLKRCDLTVVSSLPSNTLSISDDSITTTDWCEMSIFEKDDFLASFNMITIIELQSR